MQRLALPRFPKNIRLVVHSIKLPCHDEQKVRKSIQVDDWYVIIGLFMLRFVDLHHRSFRTTANRTSQVSQGSGWIPSWQNELFNLRQVLLPPING